MIIWDTMVDMYGDFLEGATIEELTLLYSLGSNDVYHMLRVMEYYCNEQVKGLDLVGDGE